MTDYRRRLSENTWHWCKDCDKYPTGKIFQIEHSKPESGELCDQCKAIEKKDNYEK